MFTDDESGDGTLVYRQKSLYCTKLHTPIIPGSDPCSLTTDPGVGRDVNRWKEAEG